MKCQWSAGEEGYWNIEGIATVLLRSFAVNGSRKWAGS